MKVPYYTPMKVTSSVIQSRIVKVNGKEDFEMYLQVHMDNGSVWETDMEGKEWKQVKKGDSELTHLFDAWNGP